MIGLRSLASSSSRLKPTRRGKRSNPFAYEPEMASLAACHFGDAARGFVSPRLSRVALKGA
jgi:hypothetical protein